MIEKLELKGDYIKLTIIIEKINEVIKVVNNIHEFQCYMHNNENIKEE